MFAVLGVFLVCFGQFLWVALHRMAYPYQIEWIEGGLLQQVVRIVEGKPLYVMPSMEYAPSLYMPLYFYVSAFFAKFFGAGFLAMRLVSFLASLIAAMAVGVSVLLVMRRRLGFWFGFLAFFLCYRASGYWLDVGRVDTLWAMWLTLLVMFLVLAMARPVVWALSAASVCYVLAIFTKQASLFMAPFLALSLLFWFGWRKSVVAMLQFVVMFALALLLAYYCWSKEFFYITLGMAGAHDFNWHRIDAVVLGNILVALPAFLVVFVAWLFFTAQPWRIKAGWFALFMAFFFTSAVSRMYAGGVENVMLPCYAMLVLLGSVGFVFFVYELQMSMLWRLVLAAAFVWNGCSAWYAVDRHIPSDRDRMAGDALVEKIRAVSGRVCATKDGYLAYLAGKDFCAHNALLVDVLNGKDRAVAERLAEEVREKVLSGYYEVLILNNTTEITDYGLEKHRVPYTASLIDYFFPPLDGRQFFPVAGGPRPGSWLVFNGVGWRDERPVLPAIQ